MPRKSESFSVLHLSPTIYHSWPTKTTYCSKLYSSPSTFECCLGFFIVLWVREITSPSNAFYWPWYRSWMKGCSKYMAFNSINSISKERPNERNGTEHRKISLHCWSLLLTVFKQNILYGLNALFSSFDFTEFFERKGSLLVNSTW